MKITIRPHTAVIIPRTITPHTIEIPTHQPLLEERRDIFLMRRITLIIHTDIPADLRFILAGFTGVPQILAAARFVVVGNIAFDGQGVAVHEQEVAVAFARVREKAFELRVAADGGVLGADEESAACAVVGGRGKAEFLFGPNRSCRCRRWIKFRRGGSASWSFRRWGLCIWFGSLGRWDGWVGGLSCGGAVGWVGSGGGVGAEVVGVVGVGDGLG